MKKKKVQRANGTKQSADKKSTSHFAMRMQNSDREIMESLAHHNGWTNSQVIAHLLRLKGKARGRPRFVAEKSS